MRKINILLALLLTLCFTGCIFRMEDFSEPYGYVFFFKNDSSENLYVEIDTWEGPTSTIGQQLNKGEERLFDSNTCRKSIRVSNINAIYLYSDSTKSNLIYYESRYLNNLTTEKNIINISNQWDEIQLDVGLAKEYFEYYKEIEELYKMTFTFTDEFLEEVRE